MDLFYHASDPDNSFANTAAGIDAAAARNAAREAATDTAFLRQEVDRLALISEALWRLLKERMGYRDDELMAEIASLDLEDGVADGRKTRGPRTCKGCNKKNARRHNWCIYCGATLRTTPFD